MASSSSTAILSETPMPTSSIQGSELVFGLVGATGSNLASVASALTDALGSVSYSCAPETVRVANLLHAFPRWRNLTTAPEDARLDAHMDAGNAFRELTGRSDAMAVLAIGAIQDHRDQQTGSPVGGASIRANGQTGRRHNRQRRW
jgi:hypothetical protein